MSAASRIVRASKFRHVFAEPAKTDDCYLDLELSPVTGDHNVSAPILKPRALVKERENRRPPSLPPPPAPPPRGDAVCSARRAGPLLPPSPEVTRACADIAGLPTCPLHSFASTPRFSSARHVREAFGF